MTSSFFLAIGLNSQEITNSIFSLFLYLYRNRLERCNSFRRLILPFSWHGVLWPTRIRNMWRAKKKKTESYLSQVSYHSPSVECWVVVCLCPLESHNVEVVPSIYSFIIFDTVKNNMWHVQNKTVLGFKQKKRIPKIYKLPASSISFQFQVNEEIEQKN